MVKNLEIKNTDNFISPIIFTPGTKFMNNLPNFLKDYFDKLRDKYHNVELIDLTDLEYGESEFKLFYKMKDIIKLNNNSNNKESNILVSNDADVIIMALSIIKNTDTDTVRKLLMDKYNFNLGKYNSFIISKNKFFDL